MAEDGDPLARAIAEGDHALLVETYRDAGRKAEGRGNIDAACFYFTQAYIFALEAGLPVAGELHESLKGHGRED